MTAVTIKIAQKQHCPTISVLLFYWSSKFPGSIHLLHGYSCLRELAYNLTGYIRGDFLRAIEKFFKKKNPHKIQKNAWNIYLNRMYDPIIQCLKIISCKYWPLLSLIWSIRLVQFQHTPSNISAGISCMNVAFQCVNWSGLVCINMSFNVAPQKIV